MKIRDVNAMLPETLGAHSPDDKRQVLDTSRMFQRALTDLNKDAHTEKIHKMCEAIFRQGEIVAKKADVTELQRYRGMIQELMNETVSNGFEFTKAGSFDARGRHRVFATINKVNSKLDELTSELLKEQKDEIEVLNKVDDIRGLLVDLFL